MAAFELSSFIVLLNFCHSSYHTVPAGYHLSAYNKGKFYTAMLGSVRSCKRDKCKIDFRWYLPTYLCSIASETSPCLHWAPADEKQQLNHVAFCDFNCLNITLTGRKMVRKIYKQIILYTLREKRKAKKIGQKIKSCLCSFYIEYNLTNEYEKAELIKNMLFIERKYSPCPKTVIQWYTNGVPPWDVPCFKVTLLSSKKKAFMYFSYNNILAL